MESWLRANLLDDESELASAVARVLAGRSKGCPPPVRLRPFDSARFWALLEDR
jgi:hypothetical protein